MFQSLDLNLGAPDPDKTHKAGALLPGQKHVGYSGIMTDPRKEVPPVRFEAEVIAVQFADGTALGDRIHIRNIQDFRSGFARELERLASQVAGFVSAENPEEERGTSLSRLYDEVKNSGGSSGDESFASRTGRDLAKQKTLRRISRAVDSSGSDPSMSRVILHSLTQAVERDAQIFQRYQLRSGPDGNK